MTGIAATTADTSLLSANQSDSAIRQAATASSSTAVTEDTPAVSVNTAKIETVEISTRAQKIQKLNEEFFSSGPKDFKVSAEFIERLEEYGFLTANEAERLSDSASVTSKTSEGASTVGELSLFIEGFIDSVEQIAPESSLIEVLQQAQTVIDNFNDPTVNSLSVNIPNITELLKNYNDTATDLLPDADKESLNQLVLALSIANVLTPGTNTTTEIDQYLAINKL